MSTTLYRLYPQLLGPSSRPPLPPPPADSTPSRGPRSDYKWTPDEKARAILLLAYGHDRTKVAALVGRTPQALSNLMNDLGITTYALRRQANRM